MARSLLVGAAVAAGVVALAVVLNPSPEKHRATIKATIAERNQLAGMLGLGALAAFASTYHSIGVASYTTVNDRTISWGAFGVVVVAQRPAEK